MVVTCAPFFGWGHQDGFASSVGHSMSDSVVMLIYDGMQQYSGHRCCTAGHLRHHQPYREWVNILGIPYCLTYDMLI
jgi:hypothetical protein